MTGRVGDPGSRSPRRFALVVGVLLAATAAAGPAPAQEPANWMWRYDRAPEYDIQVVPDVGVPMRDGIRLSTTLFFPARGEARARGPFPAVLVRHMGDSRALQGRYYEEARYFASRGYVVAVQTMRGRPGSEGEAFFLYGRQHEDGTDAVEWLARQPWSTGKVGTFGVSHAGVAQYSLATENPEGLAAMVPAFAQSNYALWSMRTGGALELRYLNWATGAATVGREAERDPVVAEAARRERARFREYLADPPFLFKFERGLSPLRFTPSYEDWLLSVVEHSTYPAPDGFWSDPGFDLTRHYHSMADVPAMHHSGWYDTYPRSMADNQRALAELKTSPQWLLLGPWTHTSALPRVSGDVDFGPEADGDYNRVRLAWFDQWLMGIETGIADDPPVKVFVMGGGEGEDTEGGHHLHGGHWHEWAAWPPEEVRYVDYYLHGDGTLREEPPAETASSTTFAFDPRNPVPSIGGNVSAFGQHLLPGAFDQTCRDDLIGCRDQKPLASRPDVLVFQTPPLERDLEIAGYIRVVLHVSSSTPDTDFTAKLIDVHPPTPDHPEGYAMNLADGILRARFRNGRDREELLEPGTVYELVVEPYPTANVFLPGHRLRLDISSSNFPRFDVNPNTGEPILKHRRFAIANNTVYHQRDRVSRIVLPVLPAHPR